MASLLKFLGELYLALALIGTLITLATHGEGLVRATEKGQDLAFYFRLALPALTFWTICLATGCVLYVGGRALEYMHSDEEPRPVGQSAE